MYKGLNFNRSVALKVKCDAVTDKNVVRILSLPNLFRQLGHIYYQTYLISNTKIQPLIKFSSIF